MIKEKGITLISLVITIIVMLIIAGTVTVSSLDSVRSAKRTAFITELEMIQEKVNTIYEKRKLNSEDVTYYDSLGQDISNVEQSTLDVILDGIETDGYRYFSRENLKQLDLDNIEQDVIINFNTKDVASVTGLLIDGKMYYRLMDIPGYQGHEIEYEDKNTEAPTFDVEINELSDSWRININNIVYNSNVATGTVSYKLHSNENWILVGDTKYFEVNEPGLYDIKLTDSAGNEKITQKGIYVTDGLIARYDGENNTGIGYDSTVTNWKDLSGNENNATILGTASWEDNKLIFDGIDDYIDTGMKQSDFGQKITIETVVEFQDTSNYRGLYGLHQTASTWSGITGQCNNGNVIFAIFSSNNTTTSVSVPSSIFLNKMTHVTVTMEGGSGIKVYLNGSLIAEGETQEYINPRDDYNFIIGKSHTLDDRYFKGTMYNFTVYNKILTEEEIKINYEIDKYRFAITE